jgi:ferric-dicitrate binding protein FerR (iron transport regulator)
MTHEDIDWSLLARYFSGVASAADRRAVEQWLDARPDRRHEVTVLRAAWDEAAALPVERKAQRSFTRVAARIGLDAAVSSEEGVVRRAAPRFAIEGARSPRRRSTVRTMRIAAAMIFLAGAAGAAWLGREHLARLHTAPTTAEAGPARELATQAGERASIELADGTRVTLGPASRLQVPARFGDRARTVTLDGDAYFVVAHDARRPFQVRTANTITEDLGTAFVIRAHTGDSVVEVIVVDGKVALRPGTAGSPGVARGVALSRGQMGRVERSGLVSVTDSVNIAAALAWTEGRLAFHKTPLRDVRRALERWYGVRIELPDTMLESVPVSASFGDQSADQALGTLARLLDLRYARDGAVARLLPRARR